MSLTVSWKVMWTHYCVTAKNTQKRLMNACRRPAGGIVGREVIKGGELPFAAPGMNWHSADYAAFCSRGNCARSTPSQLQHLFASRRLVASKQPSDNTIRGNFKPNIYGGLIQISG
jgi:hypothetical protein